jgi:hypothetical protein
MIARSRENAPAGGGSCGGFKLHLAHLRGSMRLMWPCTWDSASALCHSHGGHGTGRGRGESAGGAGPSLFAGEFAPPQARYRLPRSFRHILSPLEKPHCGRLLDFRALAPSDVGRRGPGPPGGCPPRVAGPGLRGRMLGPSPPRPTQSPSPDRRVPVSPGQSPRRGAQDVQRRAQAGRLGSACAP